MLVMLPDKMDGITDLENTILGDAAKFPILLANLTIHKVVLDLPKFDFESDLDLEKSLTNVSTRNVFNRFFDVSGRRNWNSAWENTKVLYVEII